MDDFADWTRLAIADEVGLSGRPAWTCQVLQRQSMGFGRVVDVDRVDPLFRCRQPQPAGTIARDQTRQQLLVARPPDQVRPKRDATQVLIIGCQHHALGKRLGLGIRRRKMSRIRQRLITPLDIAASMDHAR